MIYWLNLIFFSWPQTSLRGFQSNGYLQFFFVLKACYFLASALQIHFGYPPVES